MKYIGPLVIRIQNYRTIARAYDDLRMRIIAVGKKLLLGGFHKINCFSDS